MTRERTVDIAAQDQPNGDVVAAKETPPNAEAAEKSWDYELYILVSTNAEVRVRCSWTDEPVVTLGEAMLTYPRAMTEADEPFLRSMVNEMLANPPIETDEEPEKVEAGDEDKLVELEDKRRSQGKKATPAEEPHRKAQAKTHAPQVEPEPVKPPQSTAKTTGTSQELKVSITSEEKPNESANETTAAVVAVVTGSAKDRPAQSTQHSAASGPAIRRSEKPVDTLDLHKTARVSAPERGDEHAILSDLAVAIAVPRVEKLVDRLSGESEDVGILRKSGITNLDSSVATEALSAPNNKSEMVEDEPVIDEVKTGTERQPEVFKVTETEAAPLSVIEEHLVLVEPQLMTDQKPESPTWLPAVEAFGPTEPIDEIIEASEDQPTLATDYKMDAGELIDFDEEDVLISHVEEGDTQTPEPIEYHEDVEKAPPPQVGGELHYARQETVDSERLVQANITPKEIENSLTQLAKHIEASDPSVPEVANGYLDKIIETVAKLEGPGEDDIVTEAEAQEELEELFTKLFNVVGIDHTPELINYFARQTLTWHLADEVEKLQDEEDAEEVTEDSGTHAIIKKLIAALKTIKKAMTHACAIGRAALVLCNFSFQLKFETALLKV